MLTNTERLRLDVKRLDEILNTMIETVNKSKEQIFEISEQSQNEFTQVSMELEDVKRKVMDTIQLYDRLEQRAKLARTRLAEVSKHFQKYSENDIRIAYEKANEIQIQLSLVEQKEVQLRERRDDLERRLRNLKETVVKAEKLAGQTTVVLNYLNGDLKKMGELIQDAKQKQAFGFRIIEAQEEERRRISREIHDGPAQMLAHVLLSSEILDRVCREKGPEASAKEIQKFREMIRSALYEVRRIIYDLRPMSLDDLGLIPTLDKYLERLKEQYPTVELTFKTLGDEKRLPEKMEAAIFRLVQEAVQNACRHAHPKLVQVILEFRRQAVVLVVKDDGIGFDPEQHNEDSFGLLGMKERTEVLEGKMTISSGPNRGTTILIQIPILKEELD